MAIFWRWYFLALLLGRESSSLNFYDFFSCNTDGKLVLFRVLRRYFNATPLYYGGYLKMYFWKELHKNIILFRQAHQTYFLMFTTKQIFWIQTLLYNIWNHFELPGLTRKLWQILYLCKMPEKLINSTNLTINQILHNLWPLLGMKFILRTSPYTCQTIC